MKIKNINLDSFFSGADPQRAGPAFFKYTVLDWCAIFFMAAFFYLAGFKGLFGVNFILHFIHEAGHYITAFPALIIVQFTREGAVSDICGFIVIAMGTIAQLAVPAYIWLKCLKKNLRKISCFFLYMLGGSFNKTGIYVSDLRIQSLVLGNFTETHAPGEAQGDWYYLLEPLGMTDWDIFIGQAFYILGAFTLALAAFSLYYYIRHDKQYLERASYGGLNE